MIQVPLLLSTFAMNVWFNPNQLGIIDRDMCWLSVPYRSMSTLANFRKIMHYFTDAPLIKTSMRIILCTFSEGFIRNCINNIPIYPPFTERKDRFSLIDIHICRINNITKQDKIHHNFYPDFASSALSWVVNSSSISSSSQLSCKYNWIVRHNDNKWNEMRKIHFKRCPS